MRQPEQQEPSDDFQVEVTTLHDHDRESTSAAEQARSPFMPRRSRRVRTVRLGTWLVTVVLTVLLLVSVPDLREGAWRLIGQSADLHTPAPHDDLVYLLPNPPGVATSLDGKLLTHLPLPGSGHPLRLAPGRHTLQWTSQHFPFHPLTCRISVPRTAADTCPTVPRIFVPNTIADAPGAIIGMHASLAALDAADQQSLVRAIQAALAARRSTTTVRPGERFAVYSSAQPVTTDRPLQATLTFTYLSNPGYPDPCIVTQPDIPCRFPGQDCSQICTVTPLPPSLASASD